MQENKDRSECERTNMTKYGEFVCSTFHWLPIDEQKKNAEKMVNMTKDNKK